MRILILLVALISAILTHLFSFARSAMAFNATMSMHDLKVLPRHWMTTLAMSFVGILCSPTNTAQYIYALSHRFNVPRVYTRTISAYMVSNHLFWDWAKDHLIRLTVRTDTFSTNDKNAIAVFVQRILPIPAPRLRVNNIFALETLF